MPMDDRTKATVRALLDRHPNGYVAEQAGFTVTNTAAGLFRLLCVSVLARDAAPSRNVFDGVNALFAKHWDSAPEMCKTGERERAEVLSKAGYSDAGRGGRMLGEAANFLMDRYDGDLQRLRQAAGGDTQRLRALLAEIPGMDDAGCAVFLREAQMFWPEAAPFIDDHARRAARRLDLPDDAEELLTDVARGRRNEQLAWLTGALALVDVHDEYDRIRKAVPA